MMKKEKIERAGRNREGGGGAERKNGKKPPSINKCTKNRGLLI
jgi:hypothetical protein